MKYPTKDILEPTMRRLRRLEWVPRWGVIPTLRKQSVAEHSFHVAANALFLLDHHAFQDIEGFRYSVLAACITHEEDEAITGDKPSPTKTREIPEDQRMIVLKVADCLEAVQFLYVEQRMGNNMGLECVHDEIVARLHEYWGLFRWDETKKNKPLTMDLVRKFCQFALHPKYPHPLMEYVNEISHT